MQTIKELDDEYKFLNSLFHEKLPIIQDAGHRIQKVGQNLSVAAYMADESNLDQLPDLDVLRAVLQESSAIRNRMQQIQDERLRVRGF